MVTYIANFSIAYNVMACIWKKSFIYASQKPNSASLYSYCPLTHLCSIFKVIEKLILSLVTPHIPLGTSQHGFRLMYSINTLLTNVTQKVFDGINSRKPKITVIVTLDISKAFDAVPSHNLTDRIYNTDMHNNTKRWLVNFLTGRTGQVDFNSHQKS